MKLNATYHAKKAYLKIFCLSIFVLCTNPADAQIVSEKDKVLLIGDSHAYGLAPVFRADAAPHKAVVKSYAIGGTNTRQWITRGWLENSVKRNSPDAVIIILGTNDFGVKWHSSCRKYKGEEKKECGKKIYSKRASAIIDYLRKRKIKSIWVLPPKMRISTEIIDAAIRESKPDEIFNTKELDLPLEKDRVHITYKGKKMWSKAIWEFLTKI